MEDLNFKGAHLEDQDVCMSMMEDFYRIDDYPFSHEKTVVNFKEFISNAELGRFWLIEFEKQTIGYLILTFGFSFEYSGRDAFIDEFYLKAPFRGKGLGTQILTLLDKHAKDLGVKALHLEVENTNLAGNKLYTKSGFFGNDRKLLTKIIKP